MSEALRISEAVAKLYDTYPFPPEPLLDEPPPGYNWRWNWLTAYAFCTGQKPVNPKIRILDAGCGTGVGTEYLVHLNPEATVVGIDLSAGALAVAQERCQKSGATRVEFQHLSLFDVEQVPGEFDLINCVGVFLRIWLFPVFFKNLAFFLEIVTFKSAPNYDFCKEENP